MEAKLPFIECVCGGREWEYITPDQLAEPLTLQSPERKMVNCECVNCGRKYGVQVGIFSIIPIEVALTGRGRQVFVEEYSDNFYELVERKE